MWWFTEINEAEVEKKSDCNENFFIIDKVLKNKTEECDLYIESTLVLISPKPK